VFLFVIGALTVLIFSTGRFWVHYGDGSDR